HLTDISSLASLFVSHLPLKYFTSTVASSLSLHDALPICRSALPVLVSLALAGCSLAPKYERPALPVPDQYPGETSDNTAAGSVRSEEHTSELQSRENLVCRLLLEKKKIYLLTTSGSQCQL